MIENKAGAIPASAPGLGRARIEDIRCWLDSMEFAQNEREFNAMLFHVCTSRSTLEIGSRFGLSLFHMAKAMPPGGLLVAVDWPGADDNRVLDSEYSLMRRIALIRDMGHEAHALIGDSHSEEVIERVRKLGPYDFCFIDGDHSYEGVKRDWEVYGPLSGVVAFHDILGPVKDFWQEVKQGRKSVIFNQGTQ